jgi:hypothetical protein
MSAAPPEELIDRHEAFLRCAPAARPLIGGWLGGYFPAEQFPRGASCLRPGQRLSPADVRFESFRADYERLYEQHRELRDDFFFVGSAYWGIPWLEAILGCPVIAGEHTCWAETCLDSVLVPAVTLENNAWFDCLLRFTKELVDFARERFPVCAPILRGPGDTAAAMRGASVLLEDIIDKPESAAALLHYCSDNRQEVLRKVNAVVPPWHGTCAAGGYPSKIWTRSTAAYNQEDCAAFLNPPLFKQHLLPLEQQQCQSAQVNFIHLHSGCLYPIDILLQDDSYAVLEVNIDREGAGPPLADLLPTFKRIQASRRPLLLWGEIAADGWRLLRRELSPNGLSVQPILRTPQDIETFRGD